MLAENSNPDPRSASGKEGRRGEGRSPAPAVPRTWGVHGAHRMPWPSEHSYRGRCGCPTPPHPASCLLGRKSIKLPHRRQGSDAGTARDPHVRLRATAGRGRHGEDEALGPGRTSTGSEDAGSGEAEPGSGRPRLCSRADPGTRFEHEAFTLRFNQLSPLFSLLGKGAK